MKVFLVIIVGLVFIGLLFTNPIFFIGLAIAFWGVKKIKKQKELNLKSNMAPALLIIGILLALAGCVGPIYVEEDPEKAIQGVEKDEKVATEEEAPVEEVPKEEALEEDVSKAEEEAEKEKTESESAKSNTAVVCSARG